MGRGATSRGSYGDEPDFANIYLHTEIWRRGNWNKISSPFYFWISPKIWECSTVTTKQGRDFSIVETAQASLYPCTLLHLCSLDWQELRVHWAKAILLNSLPFMRRVIPHLFQLGFAGSLQGRTEWRKKRILASSHSSAAECSHLAAFVLHWSDLPGSPACLLQTIEQG